MISRRGMMAGAAVLPLLAAGRPLLAKHRLANPPATPRFPLRTEQLGRVRVDDYAWLKPANWQEVWRDPSLLDPKIRAYLVEENRYCDAVLAPTEQLQAQLVSEMKRHVPPEAVSPPVPDGPWTYYDRFSPDGQQPIYLRKALTGGAEQVLLDAAARAAGKHYLAIRNVTHSPDHRLLAWAEDSSGSEKFTILVKDLATGEIVTGPTDAFGDFVFSADSRYIFWVWRDPQSRPKRLYRRLARGGPDSLVYEEADPAFLMEVAPSASGDWLFLRSFNDVTSEVRVIDAHRPEGDPTLVASRRTGVDYSIEHWRDRFVMRTNANGAQDYRLQWAPIGSPSGPWQTWVPHRPGRTITELHPREGDFAWLERVEGNLHIIACGVDGIPREPVRFEEAAYVLAVQPSEYSDNALWVTIESPRLPPQWLRCDLGTGAQESLLQGRDGPLGRYVLKRLNSVAADGALVPVTVLHLADTPIDGSAPLLLTGYGAYGYSYETKYSAPVLALVDRGWVWAVAHVRGGSEKGRAWFEAARQLKKKTSFTDFISCAQMLIDTHHTRARRIVIHGFSAGGLLVGAAANMRPDLWSAVIGQAPFVDMLNTMSDATHPLVPLTRPVWGDPLSSVEAYDYIASYSPYENVRAQPYPATLATTAIGDDRVGFWEPAKWIANLRRRSTSGKPMLLHTETQGGHQGASGRLDEFVEMARMYAFAISQTERLGRSHSQVARDPTRD
ncbi:prolyl oligopeptidase family serine peptidase [Sphingomonas sp.]|uniref:S9 family peptidase n=1 Tax=Sphingomonas sp. TaxID=28214 RepID=UPI0025ECAEF0|nr:prolyl oligopeptidase family serine peptidase [Sphingomonas sp.]MBV9528558.1 S9 family peptidase [Sphingomonas sp.]